MVSYGTRIQLKNVSYGHTIHLTWNKSGNLDSFAPKPRDPHGNPPHDKKNDGIFSCPIFFLNNDFKHGISLDFLKYDLKWHKAIQQVKYFVSTIIDIYITKQ